MRVERLTINFRQELAYFVPRGSQFLGASMTQRGDVAIDWFVSRKAEVMTTPDASSKLYEEHDRLWFYICEVGQALPDEFSWVPTPAKLSNNHYLFYALRNCP